MLEGLCIAWEKGYKQLELECNNVFLVESSLEGGVANSSLVEL
ncbi:hypothetical protein Gogos_018721 [Gossypium gossypioides]|uniref:RNase H type-1 domain-containing protein n=1 Tax=Gossypium gossypioides TaxID=34282 RepID=A0A7J9BEX9_GOSGO|nr:hypothetical protein [Gossypium gossypioides]